MPSKDPEEDDRFQLDPERGYSTYVQMHSGAQASGEGNQLNMSGGIHVKGDLYCNVCHIISCSCGLLPASIHDTWHRFNTWIHQRPVRNPLIVATLSATTLTLIAAILIAVKDSTHDSAHDHARTVVVVDWHGSASVPSTSPNNRRHAASSTVCIPSVSTSVTVPSQHSRCYSAGCPVDWACPADDGTLAPGLTCGSWVEGKPTVLSRCGLSETTSTAAAVAIPAVMMSTRTADGGGGGATTAAAGTGPAGTIAVV